MRSTQSIFSFIENGDLPQIRQMILEDPGFLHVKRVDHSRRMGRSTLQAAAANGKLEIAKYLVEKGAEVYEISPYDFLPPVIHAFDRGHPELVKYFLEEIPEKAFGTRGLGVDIVWAAARGWQGIVEKHLQKDPYSVHFRLPGSGTALHWAAKFGQIECMELLLQSGADSESDALGKPLHWAAETQPRALSLLLASGAQVNSRIESTKRKAGCTPLMICAMRGDESLACAEILLRAGADKTLTDAKGKSALDYAQNANAVQIADLLKPY